MYESMLDTLFFEELYIKKFKSLQNEAKNAEEQHDLLMQIVTFTASLPFKTDALNRVLLGHELYLDHKLGNPDFEKFLRFLQNPSELSRLKLIFIKEYSEKFKKRDIEEISKESEYLRIYKPQVQYFTNIVDMIGDYVDSFVNDEAKFDKIKHIFKNNFLMKRKADSIIFAGEYFEQIDQVYNDKELETLKLKSYILFNSKNKKSFKADEKVEILLDVKNVEEMKVNIFEINCFNYYKKY